MSSIPSTSRSQPTVNNPRRWLYTKEEMLRAKSIQEGMSPEQELQYRQYSTRFIQEMVDCLNEYKEKGAKIDCDEVPSDGSQTGGLDTTLSSRKAYCSQLCMCAASIHMHRFFYFHSFNFFDYRDIAAASLFLSGKSEESPRKLEYIVKIWWRKKFPKFPSIPSEQHFIDAKALIVQLENVILQTIAFDLKIDLPHPIVLSVMHSRVGQAANDCNNKKLTECAYFFATDVLCVTSWGIRYSAAAIAVCCVHIVCTWIGHEIPKPADGRPWFAAADPEMTEERLREMADEFINIYHSCKDKLALKFLQYYNKGDSHSASFPTRAPPPPSFADPKAPPVEQLPPPPPPPSLARKVDYAEYKERSKCTPNASNDKREMPPQPRKSFMPDTSQASRSKDLPSLPLPGMEMSKDRRDDRRDRDRKERRKEDDPKRMDERERRDDRERRKEEKPEDRDRRREEEKRKREHDRISGYSKDHTSHGHKKPRSDRDMLQPNSSFGSTGSTNGYHKNHSSRTHEKPPIPEKHVTDRPVPNDKPLAPYYHRPPPPPPPPSTHFDPSSNNGLLAPPPPAPFMPPPPPAPPRFNASLEDGEIE